MSATVNDLQASVLRTLAENDVLTEGEIKGLLGRQWALTPTLRALSRHDLVARAHYWSWQITDAGLVAIGHRPRKPTLTLIEGGK